MTFLNPLILIALAAAAIPLLLHLLNLRKLRTVDFSSLRFLKELQKSRIRRLKLKQLLLLLLRIGLVIFAVLAFARPALRSSSVLPGAHAAATAVILIDNSFSMTLRDDQGTRFTQAKQAALEVVEMLEENDEAYVIPMTDPKAAINAQPTSNREVLRQVVNGLGLNFRRADLDDALRAAASVLDRSENINREIYIITDAQRSNALGGSDSLKLFTGDTRIYLLPIGTNRGLAGSNLALDSIRVLTSLFERDRPVELRAWIRNYGQRDVENATVSMYIEGNRVAQLGVEVKAGGSAVVELSAPPKRSGLVSGHIQVEGDDFDSDNKRWFGFPVVERMRVAIAGSPENTAPLGLLFGLYGGAITADRVAPGGVGGLDMGAYSTIILADAPVGAADARRLAEFVEAGGGLVIYAGPSTNRDDFNTTLGVSLGIGLGAPITATDPSVPLTFGSVQKEHPIFSGVFDPANPGNMVESPELTTVLPASGGEGVIRLTSGGTFMSEFRRGRGRIVYVGAPPSGAWGSVATRGIFVPIALRSALYVGATSDPFPQGTVGEPITVPLAGAQLPGQVSVVGPNTIEQFVPVRQYPSGASIQVETATEPGIYRVRAAGKELALFAANMGSGESDLTPMTEEALQKAIGARMSNPANLRQLQPGRGGLGEAITESRFGLELWKYMLALALLCAFAEMFVGRVPKSAEASA
ncbi:MAG: VWA domain-containing protein [Armatimonadetes bacterium]|nr:VWA domain-containing protein [Armatimonadota bacterium]